MEESSSRKFWKRYGLQDCYSNIEFARLIASGELCHDSFLAYEANDATYLRSFLACWGVVLMKLIEPVTTKQRDHVKRNRRLTTVLEIIRSTTEELAQVYGNAKHLSEATFETCQPFVDYIKFINGTFTCWGLHNTVNVNINIKTLCVEVALEKEAVRGIIEQEQANPFKTERHLAVLKLITVLTPCARLYAEVGRQLGSLQNKSGRYNKWTNLYSAEAFQDMADEVDELLDEQIHLAAEIGGIELTFEQIDALLGGYYKEAMRLELDIFNFYAKTSTGSTDCPVDEASAAPSSDCSVPQVLILAGSDSGGGAGIQADIKTMESFQVFSAVAITATTAQNTLGVQGVHVLPAAHFAQQMESCLSDYSPQLRVIKSGMLPNSEQMQIAVKQIKAYASTLPQDKPGIHFVCDPVMVSTSGHRLIDDDAFEALRQIIIPQSTILTPNLPEVAALIDRDWSIERVAKELDTSAGYLLDLHPKVLLVKGGHDTQGIICEEPDQMQDTLYLRLEQLSKMHPLEKSLLLGSALVAAIDSNDFDTAALETLEKVNNFLSDHSAFVYVRSIEILNGSVLKIAFRHPRLHVDGSRVLPDHGTGCTLASALASCLAKAIHHPNEIFETYGLLAFCASAIHFVVSAMKAATSVKIGNGHGPLLHSKGSILV